MKKSIFLFIALCCALQVSAGYGILVNGTTYYAAEYRGKDDNTHTFDEYLAHVTFAKGDFFQLCDPYNDAQWAVALDTYSVSGFTYDQANNRYTSSVSGCYDCYIKIKYEQDQLYIGGGSNCGLGEDYASMYKGSVPPRCEAVMMQAFFNESYKPDAPGVSDYGDTKWATLLPQAKELGRYFDYIWLPPSAFGDGMGYHPRQYSNQNSNWGSVSELNALISSLHANGAKVIADIVINHCANKDSWCDFYDFDFGTYGHFYPDESYICNNDEVNKNTAAGDCYNKASGSPDDGDNWDGARDWSHDLPKVQNMCIAYLQWIRDVMKYDGFRYDKGDGFHNWHHDNYNKHAKPEIAFMESYNNTDRIWDEIKNANYNLMALDFDTKWNVFDKFAGWDYSCGRGNGLLGRGDYKYAVTFMESHDWFLRPDNENEFGGRGNSMTETLKPRLLQCNAFLLSMPGIPCIFYPHWYKYKEFIKPMIEARRLAGVHSESAVMDEYAETAGYQATIHGKYGYLILMLGNKTQHGSPADWLSDYKLMASYYSYRDGHDESYEIWVNRTAPLPTAIDEITDEPADNQKSKISNSKILRDGQLLIMRDGKTYTVTGQQVR